MEKVSDLLKHKGSQVWTIYEDKLLDEAIEILVEHNIGSLIVRDSKHSIAGIITERDIMRIVHSAGREYGMVKINEAMTVRDKLIVGLAEDTLEYIMQVMTQNRIRHVPIIEGDKLLGMISIGDVVKAMLHAVQAENHYLREYLGDKYPA